MAPEPLTPIPVPHLATAKRPTSISDARPPASSGVRKREIRYLVTMAFQAACFLGMIWTPGSARLVLLLGAIVLPYIGMLASQVDQRTKPYPIEVVEPEVRHRRIADRPTASELAR